MPNGATVNAFNGAGKPGHRGHGGLDADIVRARDAAADADAFALPREAVVGSAARDGVHQIFAGKHLDGGLVLRCQPAIQGLEDAIAYDARREGRRR